jgi:metal-dependent HD superfamily phosphatase/phosphodiesterase
MISAKLKPQPTAQTVRGVQIELSKEYRTLALSADETIRKITADYPKTAQLYDFLLNDPEVNTYWNMANYVSVVKLGYNDHGPVHARVVTAAGLTITKLLLQHDVKLDVLTSGAGEPDDTFLVVLASTMLHDIGNLVHRVGHEQDGALLAYAIYHRLLPEIYPDPEQRFELLSFILSAITTHDCNPVPLTMEAAIVAVADGTDMTKGRGRIAFDLGKVDIHSVSALAIEEVHIHEGKETPVDIEVIMSESAGIFQVEQILARKLIVTPLAPYVTLRATVTGNGHPTERILSTVTLQDRIFRVVPPEVLPQEMRPKKGAP